MISPVIDGFEVGVAVMGDLDGSMVGKDVMNIS